MHPSSKRSPVSIAATVLVLVAALAAAACSSDASDPGSLDTSSVDTSDTAATIEPSPTDPAPAAPSSTNPPSTEPAVTGDTPDDGVEGVQPQGFTTIMARVTAADGEVCEVCLWLADTEEERGRGLMGVTDLGPAGGMAFLFESPTTGAFYMFQTPTPLSIAWFAEDGPWVGSAEMEPCLDESPGRCPLYSPDGAAYTVAVEAFEGGLDDLLMVEGSVIELLAGTEQPECDTPSS